MALSAARAILVVATLWAASGALAAEDPQPAKDEFHFVVLGDSQFDDAATFNRMIDDLTHVRPAFVVQVGDMISGYTNDLATIEAEWARFAEQVAPLDDIPFVPVPGNHDLYNAHRRADRKIEALYRERWGEPYRAFDYRNARFIVLNSDAPGEERRIGPNQFAWLKKTLRDSTAEHIFVFLHRPPASLENAEALHEQLRRYPVRFVFYGHLHHYHFRSRDGIGYVMTNAAGDSGTAQTAVGSFDHFLLVSVRDAETRFASIKADAIEAPNYVSPDDNYDLYDLLQGLTPRSVELSRGEGYWLMALPLENPTDRKLNIYVACSSPDGRWQHEPQRIPVIELQGRERYELRLSWQATHSELLPSCQLTIPFQTQHGEWIQQTIDVSGVRGD